MLGIWDGGLRVSRLRLQEFRGFGRSSYVMHEVLIQFGDSRENKGASRGDAGWHLGSGSRLWDSELAA